MNLFSLVALLAPCAALGGARVEANATRKLVMASDCVRYASQPRSKIPSVCAAWVARVRGERARAARERLFRNRTASQRAAWKRAASRRAARKREASLRAGPAELAAWERSCAARGLAAGPEAATSVHAANANSFDLHRAQCAGPVVAGPGQPLVYRNCRRYSREASGPATNLIPWAQPEHLEHRRSCACVGSSGLLLLEELGAEIDAHDFVLRFNGAPSGGEYTKYVGNKTSAMMLASIRRIEVEAEARNGSRPAWLARSPPDFLIFNENRYLTGVNPSLARELAREPRVSRPRGK